MKVTIHQANYLPYPGFFHKICQADIFVIMDDVQFQSDITNRNKIISKDKGWDRIIVPVKKNQTHKKIRDVEINNKIEWRDESYKKLCESYDTSKFFMIYKDYFEGLYNKEWKNIFELNFETIKQILHWLDIKVEIVVESKLNISGQSTQRLIEVCKKLNAETYVSGIGGKQYLNEKLFAENNINLEYQKYTPICYEQNLSKSFIQNLSIIDFLANVGPDGGKLLKQYVLNE